MVYNIILGRNEEDKKRLGERGTVFLGKNYLKIENNITLANNVLLDVVKPHVVLISGKRGGGKSYLMAVIAEGMANLEPSVFKNIGVVMLDTVGIYWTTKYPNYKQDKLLNEWGLKPKAFNELVKIYVPFGHFQEYKDKGIPVDFEFSISVNELSDLDWISVFNLKSISQEGFLITTTILKLKEEKIKNYDFTDIQKVLNEEKEMKTEVINIVKGLFLTAKSWGVFSKNGTVLKEFVKGGQVSILDLSAYSHEIGTYSIRALVVGLVNKKILLERMSYRKWEELANIERGWNFFEEKYSSRVKDGIAPLVWIFIDEAHEFLPNEGQTPATNSLIQVLREGRQPGISTVLATQQPGKIHTDVMTQSDIVISTKLTSEFDIKALNKIMQSYLSKDILRNFNDLPSRKGAAIILDDKLEKLYTVQIRPRLSWHGGDESRAL